MEQERTWDFDAGLLPLDFANTAEWHASPQPDEKLNSYPDLIGWSKAAGLLTAREAAQLLASANADSAGAEQALESAIRLREAIYHIFSALAAGEPAPAESIAILNANLADALAQSRLKSADGGFEWTWSGDERRLDRMLWPVVQSTAELLTSEALARVGECADDRGCGYLFFDTSRNHSRRWCNMESCGNRAKALRHYSRSKKG
ncbi:MAG: ABATE domain-containing protein [Anaerolineales bacterium]